MELEEGRELVGALSPEGSRKALWLWYTSRFSCMLGGLLESHVVRPVHLNPVTAPACKISRLKSAHMCLRYILWSSNTALIIMHFDENPFTLM